MFVPMINIADMYSVEVHDSIYPTVVCVKTGILEVNTITYSEVS